MDPWLRNAARRAIGFMPDPEGLALYEAALAAARLGPVVEIGSYCGRSTVYLAAGVREADVDSVVFSVDHHRGSEEHQPGQEYHDPRFVDASGRVDTLAAFRTTVDQAGISDQVVAVVGSSSVVARHWSTPLGMVFIDGGHSFQAAQDDLDSWSPVILLGGLLAIHDVFPDPADGGRPPFEIYQQALDSGHFKESTAVGSLRVLERTS
jgi:predicted O-methyltransferase YrrM